MCVRWVEWKREQRCCIMNNSYFKPPPTWNKYNQDAIWQSVCRSNLFALQYVPLSPTQRCIPKLIDRMVNLRNTIRWLVLILSTAPRFKKHKVLLVFSGDLGFGHRDCQTCAIGKWIPLEMLCYVVWVVYVIWTRSGIGPGSAKIKFRYPFPESVVLQGVHRISCNINPVSFIEKGAFLVNL